MGICIFAGDFVLDIEKSLHHLNEDFSKKPHHRNSLTQLKIKEQFINTIRFHSETKELSF